MLVNLRAVINYICIYSDVDIGATFVNRCYFRSTFVNKMNIIHKPNDVIMISGIQHEVLNPLCLVNGWDGGMPQRINFYVLYFCSYSTDLVVLISLGLTLSFTDVQFIYTHTLPYVTHIQYGFGVLRISKIKKKLCGLIPAKPNAFRFMQAYFIPYIWRVGDTRTASYVSR